MTSLSKPIIYGEVLFDCFPDGAQVLGGAPFNVAWHLQAFGDAPKFISSIGDDPQGKQVLRSMQDWEMETANVQQSTKYPTGRVDVRLENHEPHYDIVEDCAYDFIQKPDDSEIQSSDLLYHGTLALRNASSRQTLEAIAQEKSPSIFLDVNLREPWWQKEDVLSWLSRARWVKLNHHELNILSNATADTEAQMKSLYDKYQMELLIVTQGENGATVLGKDGKLVQAKAPKPQKFVDTVGAGDAFTALFIHGLLNAMPTEECLHSSLEFASKVVGLRGATTSDRAFYAEFIGEHF